MLKLAGYFYVIVQRSIKWGLRRLQVTQFAKCGKNVRLGGTGDFTFSTIEIGNDVYIGPRAVFNSTKSRIIVGNKVLFGPDVSIIGGDHRFDIIGKFIFDVGAEDKLSENDIDIVIEDDVWVGARVVLLKGVIVGRGSVIGAGSVVTRAIPPYSVAVGNPARVIRRRFDDDQVCLHEAQLNDFLGK